MLKLTKYFTLWKYKCNVYQSKSFQVERKRKIQLQVMGLNTMQVRTATIILPAHFKKIKVKTMPVKKTFLISS